jgi:hypothetical protein
MSTKIDFKGQNFNVASNQVNLFYYNIWYAKGIRIIHSKFILVNKIPPYISLNYDKSKDLWLYSGGFEAELFHTMSHFFNFTYKIINCNNDWGIQLQNKTWTGIIGKIVSKVSNL